MTAPRFGAIAAVVRKDLISLWPLALVAIVLRPAAAIAAMEPDTWIRPWGETMIILSGLATIFLTISVFHQDGLASVRHDWRTRPLGSATLLTGKLAFIALTIFVPGFLSQMVGEFRQGHSIGEAVWASLYFSGLTAIGLVPVALVAMVTLNVIEAGLLAFAMLIPAFILGQYSTNNALGGSAWVAAFAQIALLIALCAVMAWLLHRRATGLLPKAVLAGGLLAAFAALVAFPTSVAVAVQEAVTPASSDLDTIGVFETETCLATPSMLNITVGSKGVPAGQYLYLDRTSVVVSTPERQRRVYRSSYSGAQFDKHGPLGKVSVHPGRGMQDATFGATRRHDLTLMQPGVSEDLLVDGPRRLTANFGYCTARSRTYRNATFSVSVQCFKPLGRKPALVAAELVGVDESAASVSKPNYGPGVFAPSFTTSTATVPAPAKRATVRLTAMTATAHFSRTTQATGRPAACPREPT